jgi:hypothetical protein
VRDIRPAALARGTARAIVRAASSHPYLALKSLRDLSDGGSDITAGSTRGDSMARIIVTTDHTERSDTPVLLEERVYPVHISSDHGAAQLMERLAWAIGDAENAERMQRAQ